MNNKIIVIVIAFFIGYFFVSLLLANDKKKNKDQESNNTYNNQHKEKEDYKSQNSDLWYNILEVKKDASLQEIKKAYRKKILQYHPDKVSCLGKEFQILAEEKTKKINAAYNEALKIKRQ